MPKLLWMDPPEESTSGTTSKHIPVLLTYLDLLLPHPGSGAVGCSENAPHAEDQPPCSGSMQAAGASLSQHGPTARLGL